MDDIQEQRLQGLPLSALVAAPLQAAAEAQRALARTTIDFMTEVGFTNGGTGQETRMLEFSMNRPGETSEGYSTSQVSVQVPVLALVPIPSLAVEEVTVDFQMEVTTAEQTKEQVDTQIEAQSNDQSVSGIEEPQVTVSGKVSSSASQTRETNQSAKYQIHVVAKKQEPTEAFCRLLDIFAACVTPTETIPGGIS